MAYQDPQSTVEPYDYDQEIQRLLNGGQDAGQPTRTGNASMQTPGGNDNDLYTPTAGGGGGAQAPAPAAASAPTLPAQPSGGTNADAYANATVQQGTASPSTHGTDYTGTFSSMASDEGYGGRGSGEQDNPTLNPDARQTRRNAVTQWYQQYWGRPAADWEQDYWANQDNLSLEQIEQTLRDAPEATANGGRAGGAGTGTTTTGGYSKDTDWGAPGNIEGYFKSRGVTPRSGSADYWRGKWAEWGKNDPAYFFQRLAQAEEFGGGGGGGGAMPPNQNAPTAPASTATPPATDPRILKAIEDLLRRGETPVTGEDPAIRAQFNPTAEVMQRNAARAKANASERAFSQGQFGESATNVANSQIDQSSGLDQAQLMSQLVTTEIAGRRQDVVNAIGFAQGEQKTKLQLYLAQLDEAYRRAQLDLQRWEAERQNERYYWGLNANVGSNAASQNP